MKLSILSVFFFLGIFQGMFGNIQPPVQPNLTQGEYYFDTDPGIGKGTSFTFATADSVSVPLNAVSTNNLPVGFHKIYFRLKDANMHWGLSVGSLFEVYSTAPTNPQIPILSLKAGEYFFDTDPGVGKGTAILIPPSLDTATVNLAAVPTTNLTAGYHKIYFRVKNSSNQWGHTAQQSFYVYNTTPPQTQSIAALVAGEYFFDQDPGEGKGTAISFSSADSVSQLLANVSTTGLAVGYHKFYARFKDANKHWGPTSGQLFYVYNSQAPIAKAKLPIKAAEYFFDANDYGVGQCAPFGNIGVLSDSLTIPGSAIATDPVFLTALDTGVHTINVRVQNTAGSWSLTKSTKFTVCGTKAVSAFTVSVNGTQATFTNHSTKAFGYKWLFGDGATDTTRNTTHTYYNAGNMLVGLVAYSACGNDTSYQTITLNCVTPVAKFTASVQHLAAVFTNTSTNGNTFAWNFGDGNSSTEINPVHVFKNTGTYTVCMSTTNSCGTSSTCSTVAVVCTAPVAKFTPVIDGLTVAMIDSSTNAYQYAWNFGNSQTNTTDFSPIYEYSTPGTYSIRLTVQNGCGVNSVTHAVTLTCVAPHAYFEVITSGLGLEVVNNTVNGSSYSWSFGDNTTTPFQNPPIHTYLTSGNYNVCLKTTNGCGSDSLCQLVSVCVPPKAAYTSTYAGNSINFNNQSTNGLTYLWHFGDSLVSNITNPTHLFKKPGVHTTCLIANNQCGSDTLCKTDTTTCSPFATQPICMVTVDDSSHHNKIIWQKPVTTNIDSFYIYREISTNVYGQIAALPYNAISEYSDTNKVADPNVTQYTYQMAFKDSCGYMSAMSPAHTTICLLNSGSSLIWNTYVGATVSSYQILRDDLGTGKFAVISTLPGNNTIFNDPNGSTYPNAVYRVEVVWGVSCNSTAKVESTYSVTKSNTHKPVGLVYTGLNQLNVDKYLNLYPNPAQNQVNIEFVTNFNYGTLQLYSLVGALVQSKTITGSGIANSSIKQHEVLNLSGIAAGVYYVILDTDAGRLVKKLVIE